MLEHRSEKGWYPMVVLWQELYRAAMLELDGARLEHRIAAAHAAMQRRMEELPANNYDRGGSLDEHRAIADALQNLRTLQRVEFNSSPSPSSTAQG
jgi:hypothetical protein